MTAAIIASFLAVFVRVSAFLFTAPLIGDRTVPPRVRVMAAVAFAIVLTPVRGPMTPEAMALSLPLDLMIGLAAGFSGRLILAAAEAGGQILGLPFSLGFASTFDPTLGEQALVTRRLAITVASFAFLSVGGLEAGVRAMATAPTDVATVRGAVATIIERSGDVLSIGLRFAAPALLAGLITNIGLGLASRAAPSLNVFSVMLAAMLVVGGITLIATAPAFARQFQALARYAIDVMNRTVSV